MNRHIDWCVIICLIGGGQEINTGEAGLSEWFRCLNKKYSSWDVYCAPNLEEECLINTSYNPDLHLSVSIRSFRSELLSEFVHNVVENNPEEAKRIYLQLENKYPIFITRNLAQARSWIKQKARGTERYGMLASSNGLRLRPEGIHVKNDIKCENWFLNEKSDIRSSFSLEEVATEFDVQGLELDWALVCWDINYRIENNSWAHYSFRGTKWQRVNKEEDKKYLMNSYRVLLTRARQGMVIFIPEGSTEDETRKPKFYDDIYEYLKSCGIRAINSLASIATINSD